jgi:hypothetical protein
MPFEFHRRDYATANPCENNCPDCACREEKPTQRTTPANGTNPFRVLSNRVVDLVTARQVAALVERGDR